MADRTSVAFKVGDAARLSVIVVGGNAGTMTEDDIADWGRTIIEKLRSVGLYINQARNDPSGRW